MEKILNRGREKILYLPSNIGGIMKLTTMIMLLTVANLFANGSYSQTAKISLDMRDASVKEVLETIEDNSEYFFAYSSKLIDVDREVNVDANNSKISGVLDVVFSGTDVEYTVFDRQIVLSLSSSENSTPQNSGVSGVVKDSDGYEMAGVTVMLKGTNKGALTDMDGKFSFKSINKGDVLTFSFVGMKSQEVTFESQSSINITMEIDAVGLEEVVAIGYGVQKKENLIGSVATVDAKKLADRPAQNISSAIAGTMPGVTVIQNSGKPGSQTGSITVRGKNSISGGSPLVIVDGVPGSMSDIDPQDVGSISVLKDAASAAIYGVQAANGVILITTKRGTRGSAPQISYSGNFALSKFVVMPEYVNAAEYATLYNEATLNENPSAVVPYSDEDIQKYKDGSSPYTHPDTDWLDELLENFAQEQHHYIGVSGGTEATAYNLSLGYLDQGGLVENYSYDRINLRANIDSNIKEFLTVGMNMSFINDGIDRGWTSPEAMIGHANRLPAIYTPYNPDGSYAFQIYDNPLAEMELDGFRTYDYKEIFLTGFAEATLVRTLKAKGVYSFRHNQEYSKEFKDYYTYQNEDGSLSYDSGRTELYENNKYTDRTTVQFLLNYSEMFGQHDVKALAGYEQYEYLYNVSTASRYNLTSTELPTMDLGDPSTQLNTGSNDSYARQSIFGRVQYNYASRYLAEVNLRYDGSSRFADGNRWGLFPAISAGWRVSEETFMQDLSQLDNLKLRIGWGQMGNEESGYYDAVSTYSADTKYPFGDSVYSGTSESRYANESLSWATVKSLEIGLEGSMWNGALGFELALYQKNTEDMLLNVPIPSLIGLPSPKQNAGEMKNSGVDLSLTHFNQVNDDFSYNASISYAFLKNEITDMKGTEGADPDNDKFWYLEGEALGSFYGYKSDGLLRDQADVDSSPLRLGSEQPGDIKYVNIDDSNDKIDGEDRTVIGKNFPTHTLGVAFSGNYKRFDFSVLFQGAFDVDAYLSGEASYAFFNGANALKSHLDRWTPENLDGTYPRITHSSQTNFVTSDYWLEDASYMRLKNLTIGYTVDKDLLKSIGVNSLKLFLSGENLLTFTGLDYYDPEVQSTSRGATYGNVKKYSVGVKLAF